MVIKEKTNEPPRPSIGRPVLSRALTGKKIKDSIMRFQRKWLPSLLTKQRSLVSDLLASVKSGSNQIKINKIITQILKPKWRK